MAIKLMKHKAKSKLNEGGFASIVIALVLIIVLALLTIGFAQLARREQQNALNKQLADQAYYAAESGVNDAYRQIKTWLANGTNPDPNICLGASGTVNAGLSVAPANRTFANSGVSYSCILVNMRPPTILWQDVSSESDRSASFNTIDPNSGALASINRLTVFWGSSDSTHNVGVPSGTQLLPRTDWLSKNYPPVLEVSLTAVNPSFSRTDLINNTANFLLYPSASGSGTVRYDTTIASASNQAPIVQANCSGGGQFPCSVTIDHINGGSNTLYLLHTINHYETANIMVGDADSANGGGGGTTRDFADGQAQIDVTAKARNVLKRLQVRVPLGVSADLPPGPIEGQGICKREAVYPATSPYDPYGPNNPYGASDSACLVP